MSKSEAFRILKDKGNSYRWNPDAFCDVIDKNRSARTIKDESGKIVERCSALTILEEISDYTHGSISVPTLKNWKMGYNGPADISMVIDTAEYFGIDFHDLLIPLEGDEPKKLNIKERELVSYVYGQIIDIVDFKLDWVLVKNYENNKYVVERELSFSHKKNFVVVNSEDEWWEKVFEHRRHVKEKCDLVRKEIEKYSLETTKSVRNRLHRLLLEAAAGNYEERWEPIIGEDYMDWITDHHWFCDDRHLFFKYYSEETFWYINMEMNWLEDMSEYNGVPIDDNFEHAYDEYQDYLEKHDYSDIERGPNEGYGSGSLYSYAGLSPRDCILHSYSEGLRLMFLHDFPELEELN